jgi:hypothetical protein
MACPPFGDVPLWNAAHVRGKMVAIMRGPTGQSPTVPFIVKAFHAQVLSALRAPTRPAQLCGGAPFPLEPLPSVLVGACSAGFPGVGVARC